jgi:PAS domain S-box-containing protein
MTIFTYRRPQYIRIPARIVNTDLLLQLLFIISMIDMFLFLMDFPELPVHVSRRDLTKAMSEDKKNILLVEDELIIAHAEAQTLKDKGYSVVISPNAAQAIEAVKSGMEIDLILMDVDLGRGMDGTDAAEIILRERDIPILFLSSHTEPEIVAKTEKITSYGYIVKNTGDTVLFASINMAFRLHEARVQTKMHGEMLRIALSERMRAEEEAQKINKELSATIEKLESINKELIRSKNELVERDKALRESEAIIRNLVNNLPLGIHRYRLEKDGRLIFEGSNPAADRMLGVDNNQFIGMSIEKAFPGLVETEVPDRYRQACSNGTPWHTEQIQYEDRQIKGVFEVNAFQTEPGRMAAMFNDVTERKKIERELSDTKAMLESAFEQTPIPMALVSMPDLIIRYANSACGEILGVDDWTLYIGKSFLEINQTWQDFDAMGNPVPLSEMPLAKAMRGIVTKNVEYSIQRKDGTVRSELVSASPILNKNNETIGAYLVFPDITERKLAEKALVESEVLFRLLFEESPVAIVIMNSEGIVTDINPAHEMLCGYPARELIGLHFAEFPNNIKDDIPKYQKFFSEMMQGKKFYNLEIDLKHRNGMIIHTEFDVAPLKTGNKIENILILIRDVTDRKLAERALTKMLEEKEILLRELHHRVKNSFAIVTGIVGLEANRLDKPAMKDVLMDIRNRIGSLSNLYAILNHEHEVKDIRLDHYLDQMSRSLTESYASEKGLITMRMDLAEISIDVSRAISIGLIVNELLTNALKYAFPGSRKGSIGIELKQEGGAATIVVSDNGVGLPSGFDMNKTKGLGLELVRLLTNQLDGTIAIESDGETKFRISIPL